MSLAFYPNSPVSETDKWMTFNATTPPDASRQKETDTSMKNFPSLPPPSTDVIPTPDTLLIKTRDNITKVAAGGPKFERKLPKGWFWYRKWDFEDVASISWFAGIHVLAACAPFVFDSGAIRVAVVLGFLTGFGITLGYHRLLCHRSFKVPKWLEYFVAYCGAHAFQRDPMFYVNTHKSHHKYTDTERDPVCPGHGFWYSNMGWFCNNDHVAKLCGESRGGQYSKVPELKAQLFYRLLHDTYFWQPAALGALLYLYGGFPYLAWALGMRAVVVHHLASLASYASHLWGDRPWNSPDAATNHWLVALLTLGEGWHNNHHAFQRSARHGLEWWQFDPTWELIKFLQLVGLATNVRLPTEAEKARVPLH
ncbi:hypothetical protein LXL04_014328 [Taraxacum kok-saghyz]